MTGERPEATTTNPTDAKTKEAKAQEQALANFFEAAFGKPTVTKTADAGNTQMERVNQTTTVTQTQGDAKDPFTYTRAAGDAAVSLYQLVKSNDNSPEAATRKQQLQETIQAQMTEAVKRADAIQQTGPNGVETLLNDFHKNKDAQKDALATQLGFDPRTVSTEQIQQKFGSGNVPRDTMQKAEDLFRLQSELESIQKLRMAPAVVRTQYADLLSQGFLESDASQAGKPGAKISQDHAMQAYQMLREAARLGSNNEVRNSDDFQRVAFRTTMQYADFQNDRCKDVITAIQKADEFNKAGKTKEAEDQYKEAMKKGDSVDLKFVMQQLNEPRNQQNQEVMNGLRQIVMATEGARTEYARFLNQQGRFDEALPLLIKVQADTPQLVANDKGFQEMISTALRGTKDAANETDSPQAHLTKYDDAIQRKDYKAAEEEIKAAKALAAKYANPEVLDKDLARLDTEKKSLEDQKKALDKNNSMSDEDKKLEMARLDSQLGLMKAYADNLKNNKNAKDYIDYKDAYLDYVKGDNDSAHAKFEAFKQANPTMANNPDFHMDDLMEATRHKGWFERNIKGILIGAAVVVGAAVAIGTFGAALPAEAGIAATLGVGAVAFGAGTIAGTGAYVGGTAAFTNEKITWGTVAEGAKWASLGASIVAPEVGAELGLTGAAARLFTAGTFASTTIASNAAVEVANTNKGWGSAFKDQLTNPQTAFAAIGGYAMPVGGLLSRGAVEGGGFAVGNVFKAAMGSNAYRLTIGLPLVAGPAVDAGRQVYNKFHYPLDPVKNREEMAEREGAQRSAQQMPLVEDTGNP